MEKHFTTPNKKDVFSVPAVPLVLSRNQFKCMRIYSPTNAIKTLGALQALGSGISVLALLVDLFSQLQENQSIADISILIIGLLYFLFGIYLGKRTISHPRKALLTIILFQFFQLFRFYFANFIYAVCAGPLILVVNIDNNIKGFLARLDFVDFIIIILENSPVIGGGINVIPLTITCLTFLFLMLQKEE